MRQHAQRDTKRQDSVRISQFRLERSLEKAGSLREMERESSASHWNSSFRFKTRPQTIYDQAPDQLFSVPAKQLIGKQRGEAADESAGGEDSQRRSAQKPLGARKSKYKSQTQRLTPSAKQSFSLGLSNMLRSPQSGIGAFASPHSTSRSGQLGSSRLAPFDKNAIATFFAQPHNESLEQGKSDQTSSIFAAQEQKLSQTERQEYKMYVRRQMIDKIQQHQLLQKPTLRPNKTQSNFNLHPIAQPAQSPRKAPERLPATDRVSSNKRYYKFINAE